MSENSGTERREFTRMPIEAEVKLVNANGKWKCELIDISLRGLLTSLPKDWQGRVGEPYLIELHVTDSNLKIHMNGTVVRLESNRIGFKAQHIGQASIVNLSTLVKNHIGDTEILNRELSALFG